MNAIENPKPVGGNTPTLRYLNPNVKPLASGENRIRKRRASMGVNVNPLNAVALVGWSQISSLLNCVRDTGTSVYAVTAPMFH